MKGVLDMCTNPSNARSFLVNAAAAGLSGRLDDMSTALSSAGIRSKDDREPIIRDFEGGAVGEPIFSTPSGEFAWTSIYLL